MDLPSLSTADWLTAAGTQAVVAAIAAGGFEARIVGGAVRNALLGEPVSDIDIATTALPDDVIRLAAAAGLATIATGLAHGTVTVLADRQPFEVTTLRRDVESHGRHATVAFSTDWATDASRRDFTINALYCAADGTIHDPLGGYSDVLARRVRFIGDASQRIREDYLRILRFFRFTAQYAQAAAEPAGLLACVRERAGLARLSGERVRQELLKLLIAPGALPIIETMRDHGILTLVLPVAPHLTLLRRLVEIETKLHEPADAALRLAALTMSTTEDADRLSDRLRLSGDERDRLMLAATNRPSPPNPPDQTAARALLYRTGSDDYRALIKLAWARAMPAPTSESAWTHTLSLPDRWAPQKFPIKGADILALGLPPSPEIGRILRELEDQWIADDFAADRPALLQRLATQLGPKLGLAGRPQTP